MLARIARFLALHRGLTTLKPMRSPDPPVPAESALLWGLLHDAICAPVWLVLLLVGKAHLADGARPFVRLMHFATSARMTATLILLNLLVFAWELQERAMGLSPARFMHRFAVSPADLVQGNYLPLLTHLFAHAGVAHLLGNMLTLFVFGRVVERHLGGWLMLASYLGAALVSTSLSLGVQIALHQNVPTLGASGAVAGMVALGILFAPFTVTFEALVPMPLLLLGWLAMAADFSGITLGRDDGIDHFAHLGGYLSVLFVWFLLPPAQRLRLRAGLFVNLASAVVAALLWLTWVHR